MINLDKFKNINPNLFILFRELVSDPEIAKRFSNCKTLEEFYNFCSKIVGGYTKEELKEFLLNLALLTLEEKNDKILLKDDLEKISGGARMNITNNRYISALMGVLSLLTVTSATNLDVHAVNNNTAAKKVEKKDSEESLWERLVGDVILGAGVGAVVGTAVYYAHRAAEDRGGIPNLGNSCYLNALTQQLYSVRSFYEQIMKDGSDDKRVVALRYIFTLLDKGDRLEASNIRKFIKDLGYNGKQQDATEFLINERGLGALLGKYRLRRMFSEPLNIREVPNGTSLLELLSHGGELDTHLVHNKIKELHPEKADWAEDDARWADERTEFLESSENKEDWKLHSPSAIRPSNGQFGVLVNRTSSTYTSKGNLLTSKIRKAISIPPQIEKDGVTYYLTGATVHSGRSMGKGHYYSYKKNARDEWVCYNDSVVSIESEEQARRDMECNGTLFIYTTPR